MKRLANLKNSGSNTHNPTKKSMGNQVLFKQNRHWPKNNPYPQSSYPPKPQSFASGRPSTNTGVSHHNGSFTSYDDAVSNVNAPLRSNRSAAPTLATNPETIHSEGTSHAGTSNTAGGALSSTECPGANSTFSSPQHSQESLTTTLTTVQSTTPSGMLSIQAPHINASISSPIQFSHQYPVNSPASAIPSHLAPNHPHTYQAATANNILTDNASILTLASSSKRRRRHSLDTDASVRALAPSSIFGASRESLPLSVLSGTATVDGDGGRPSGIYSSTSRPSVGGLASAERASLYSTSASLTGIPPPSSAANRDTLTRDGLNSERNSYYASKSGDRAIDATSVRSGVTGHGSVSGIMPPGTAASHGRENSISGSFTGIVYASSPLASPKEASPSLLRRGSRMSEEIRAESLVDEERVNGVEEKAENVREEG